MHLKMLVIVTSVTKRPKYVYLNKSMTKYKIDDWLQRRVLIIDTGSGFVGFSCLAFHKSDRFCIVTSGAVNGSLKDSKGALTQNNFCVN